MKNKIPSTIGEHDIALDIPPGMHHIIDGKLQPIATIEVRVRVTGFMIDPGKAEQYLLVDWTGFNVIDRGKVRVKFDEPASPYPVTAIHTEDELEQLLNKPGIVRIRSRVRLPRIRTEKCYWPPSERVVNILRQKFVQSQFGQISDLLLRHDGARRGRT